MELLIERAANAYFWVFIIVLILNALYAFSRTYAVNKENAVNKGRWPDGINAQSIIMWTLFILSCYYR